VDNVEKLLDRIKELEGVIVRQRQLIADLATDLIKSLKNELGKLDKIKERYMDKILK